MNIKKATYAKHVPGKVDYHYIAFLTRSGEILLAGGFVNSGDAKGVAKNIMRGKDSSLNPALLPLGLVVFLLSREHYNKDLKDLAEMAKAGELIDCIVIENAPESTDEILAFADKTFKAQDREP
jgi:hypothetical protein